MSEGSSILSPPPSSLGGLLSSSFPSEDEIKDFNTKMAKIVEKYIFDETIWLYGFLRCQNPEPDPSSETRIENEREDPISLWEQAMAWNAKIVDSKSWKGGDCILLAKDFHQQFEEKTKLISATVINHTGDTRQINTHVCPALKFHINSKAAIFEALGGQFKKADVTGVVLFDVGLHSIESQIVSSQPRSDAKKQEEQFFCFGKCVVRYKADNTKKHLKKCGYTLSEFKLDPLTEDQIISIIRDSLFGVNPPTYRMRRYNIHGDLLAELNMEFLPEAIKGNATNNPRLVFRQHLDPSNEKSEAGQRRQFQPEICEMISVPSEQIALWANILQVDAKELEMRIRFLANHTKEILILSKMSPNSGSLLELMQEDGLPIASNDD